MRFVVGVLAVLFPMLILVGTATRLAAARREERYAAMRLVGATPRQISVVASVDAMVSALLGVLLGIGIFALVRPALANASLIGTRYFAFDVTPTTLDYVGMLVGVPIVSAIAALLSLRRVRISPLGVTRRVDPSAAQRVAGAAAGHRDWPVRRGPGHNQQAIHRRPRLPRPARDPGRPGDRRAMAHRAGGAPVRMGGQGTVAAAGRAAAGR